MVFLLTYYTLIINELTFFSVHYKREVVLALIYPICYFLQMSTPRMLSNILPFCSNNFEKLKKHHIMLFNHSIHRIHNLRFLLLSHLSILFCLSFLKTVVLFQCHCHHSTIYCAISFHLGIHN